MQIMTKAANVRLMPCNVYRCVKYSNEKYIVSAVSWLIQGVAILAYIMFEQTRVQHSMNKNSIQCLVTFFSLFWVDK